MNFMNGVHVALLGDPTLKLHYIMPPLNLSATLKDSLHVNLTWTASSEPVLGYNIYKNVKVSESFVWIKLNTAIINSTTLIDSCVSSPDTFKYLVRAVVLESTPSGTYFNESLAATATFRNALNLKPLSTFAITNSDPSFTFNNTSLRSKTYKWTFSDTSLSFNTNNSNRTYKKNGDFWVLLTSSNQCSSDTQKINIKVTKAVTGSIQSIKSNIVSIYPNPFKGLIIIESENGGTLSIFSLDGKLQSQINIQSEKEIYSVENLSKGIYLLEFTDKFGRREILKLLKE
jgi:hypothetical protein